MNKGKIGEQKAIEYLKNKQYKIIATNYRYKKAEIDIICIKNKIITLVEVKYRSYINFFNIKKTQYENFIKVIRSKFEGYSISFDIIIIYDVDIIHYENVYIEELCP